MPVKPRLIFAQSLAGLALLCGLVPPALALDFRSVAEPGVIFYDAPSLQAKKLYVVSRYYPVEVIVSLEAWLKVRDQRGDLAWVEKKNVSDKRMVVVTAALAQVRKEAKDDAAVVFQAEKDVALEWVNDAPPVGGNDPHPGWVKVRHSDGASGYVRINQVWGL